MKSPCPLVAHEVHAEHSGADRKKVAPSRSTNGRGSGNRSSWLISRYAPAWRNLGQPVKARCSRNSFSQYTLATKDRANALARAAVPMGVRHSHTAVRLARCAFVEPG